jgi:hypothetical protein
VDTGDAHRNGQCNAAVPGWLLAWRLLRGEASCTCCLPPHAHARGLELELELGLMRAL